MKRHKIAVFTLVKRGGRAKSLQGKGAVFDTIEDGLKSVSLTPT